jgi:hypothetical protein
MAGKSGGEKGSRRARTAADGESFDDSAFRGGAQEEPAARRERAVIAASHRHAEHCEKYLNAIQ